MKKALVTPQMTQQQGFTIVEVIVTMIIVALFLTGFFQSYLLLESQRINVSRQAKASDIAYSNLRKVTIRPSGLTCDTATMDLTTGDTANKTGKPVSFTPESSSAGIGSQNVVVFAPSGCSGTNFDDNPVKIVSTVTYGTNGDKVTHASFVQ